MKSIPTKVQRYLHNRTFGKEPGRNQRQPWPHNQGTQQRFEENTHDRKSL